MRPLAVLALLSISHGAFAAEITITAADGYPLKADYYAGESGQPGVLLLHQCTHDRSMFQELGRAFAEQGIHALSLDLRGFGGSASEEFDFVKAIAGLETREEIIPVMTPISRHWPSDVDAAMSVLRERIGARPLIGAGGATCGGAQASALTLRTKLSALMLLSSRLLADADRDAQLAAVSTIPTLLIVAEGHEPAYRGNQELLAAARHQQSRMIVYQGDAHGDALFHQDPSLIDSIVSWFRAQLDSDTSEAQ